MTKFNENDPEPPFIARDEFYRRYTFEYKARTLKVRWQIPSFVCIAQTNALTSPNQAQRRVYAKYRIAQTTLSLIASCTSARAHRVAVPTTRAACSPESTRRARPLQTWPQSTPSRRRPRCEAPESTQALSRRSRKRPPQLHPHPRLRPLLHPRRAVPYACSPAPRTPTTTSTLSPLSRSPWFRSP